MLLTYSVEADVTPDSAWRYRTNVDNWNDPPATFAMAGPFEAGSRGTTQLPGQSTLHWRIAALTPGKSFVIDKSFVIEMPLDGAMLSFE